MSEQGGEKFNSSLRQKIGRTGVALATTATAGLGISPQEPSIQHHSSAYETVINSTSKMVKDIFPAKYAHFYEVNPKIGPLEHPHDLIKTFDQLDHFLTKGDQITNLSIVGEASDDDIVNKSAGLGETYKLNQRLAEKRGTVFEAMLIKLFNEHGIKPPEMSASGFQDVLPPDEIKHIQKIARSRGLSVLGLISDFDNPQYAVPQPVKDLLQTFISKHRDVQVSYTVTDIQGTTRKINKTHKIGYPLLLQAYLADEPKQKEFVNDRFPEPKKTKLNRGYAKPVERIKEPVETRNTTGNRAGRQQDRLYNRNKQGKELR